MITEKLKYSTRHFHQLAEELSFSDKLSTGAIGREEYIILLRRLHCFFSQAKILSDNSAGITVVPGHIFEEKIAFLNSDLRELGSAATEEPLLFDKLDYHAYLGFCYVPLGSMLGGQMIYNSLVKSRGDKGDNLPVGFYESCKPTVFTSWKEFTSRLEMIDERRHDEILNGARISYLYFIYLCTVLK